MTVTIGDEITGVGTLHVTDCPTCGCMYAIPDGIYRNGKKWKAKRTIYCPNGHEWHYLGKTHDEEVRELRDQVARANARRDQAEAAERMARAREGKWKKESSRLKQRAAAGVCPCCHRHFTNVERHVKTKHPDYVAHE